MCPPQGKTLLLAFTDPWMIYTCAVALSLYVCARVCVFACLCQREKLQAWSHSHTHALISRPFNECSPSLIGMFARMSLFATHIRVCLE